MKYQNFTDTLNSFEISSMSCCSREKEGTRVQMLLSEHKKGKYMSKAKRHWWKRGVPATSTCCSDHLSRQLLTIASTFPCTSRNSSAEHIHAFSTCLTLTNTLTHSPLLTYSLTHTHTHTYTHTQAHAKKAWMFDWVIFRAARKVRGGGQELSAAVIRAASWCSWYLPFRPESFCFRLIRPYVHR